MIFDLMKSAKAQYKRALRHKDRGDFKVVSDHLHDCLLNKDQPSFWKTWKTKFTHKGCNPDVIDGCSEPAFIANKFATIFETACAPNNSVLLMTGCLMSSLIVTII